MAEKVLIIGAGHQGISMAAHLALHGVQVSLWNRSHDPIREIERTKSIEIKGVVNGVAHIHKVSTSIESVLEGVIMVTVPASAHRDIARMLALYITENHVIILNPGRTLGILEFRKSLFDSGCKALPMIAETQTILYTCRRKNRETAWIFARKNDVRISAFQQTDLPQIIRRIPECIRNSFCPVTSWVQTSLGNVGMILHCLPVLVNIGWIENNTVEFRYYYDGITPTIARMLEQLDEERVNVATAMGYSMETIQMWLKRSYEIDGENLYECLQNNIYYKKIDAPTSLYHRYLEEDIPCGLVPLESIGKKYGVLTPLTSLIIDLANAVMNCDYRRYGRKIQDCQLPTT